MSPSRGLLLSLGGFNTAYLIPHGSVKISGAAEAEPIHISEDPTPAVTSEVLLDRKARRDAVEASRADDEE